MARSVLHSCCAFSEHGPHVGDGLLNRHREHRRAALARRFLESNPGRLDALQALLGHARLETIQTYLRRLDTEKAMEAVRGLSWGPRLAAFAGEAHTGFEPVLPP